MPDQDSSGATPARKPAVHAASAHHDHAHAPAGGSLSWALLLTFGFAAIEALGGWWSGSLALLGDAGHMFSDAVALGLAALAAVISRRPPSARHSYGLLRAEVLAALANGLLMLAVVVGIVVEAIRRLQQPQPVSGLAVVGIAAAGLAVNVIVALLLSRGSRDLNVRAALLHVIGDLLGSVAALIAGAVIYYTGWTPIDPILSLAICALILYSTLRLLRDSLHVLMEGVPAHLDLDSVGHSLARVPGVVSVHDLHIWMLSSGMPALSAHVVLARMTDWTDILERMRELLHERYGIDHITLQPEIAAPAHKVHLHPAPPKKTGP
jgi:cobalt-zinc-cadmium efflux system protein